jgi:hypothetical protein
MKRMLMLTTVALVMAAMMVAMAAPAFGAAALLRPTDQGTVLQVTPQTQTQGTFFPTVIHPTDPFAPNDPYAPCQPTDPYQPGDPYRNPVCQGIT